MGDASSSQSVNSNEAEGAGAFVDADFVSQLLGDNADRDDPLLQAALAQLGGTSSQQQPQDPAHDGGADKNKKRKGSDN